MSQLEKNNRSAKSNELSVREQKETAEKTMLSPYAQLSSESRGRLQPELPCPTRTIFERDTGRIIYSLDFRRLRHKTQVFFNPRSDHVCTRIEHVYYVSYIARMIGSGLGLNQSLIEAIALAHDLGHAPFGHSGEAELNALLRKSGADLLFQHEAHSLRVIDILAERHGKRQGLNLSFEVRDGVASHCGERYQEDHLIPLRDKTEAELVAGIRTHAMPATLEGCVVRIADRIAYLGRDIEDAARAGLMDFEDIPKDIQKVLGSSNAQIVNSLVNDVIAESKGEDAIRLSPEKAQCMSDLLQLNSFRIYRAEKVHKFEFITRQYIDGLYQSFSDALLDPEAARAKSLQPLTAFLDFCDDHPEQDCSNEQKICDYIAGMTDSFATQAFNQLYQI
ncbi:MAG: HD domain-containing protein [Eubacteriales bacterium]|nr:HD domain-containing protein [Eubacteriales bacterium]